MKSIEDSGGCGVNLIRAVSSRGGNLNTVTISVPSTKRSKTQLVVGLVLVLGPLPLAAMLLVLGLFGPLVWVYLSIAVTVLWIPLLVIGIVVLTRPPRSRWQFNAPPGWPAPPVGWSPPPGWAPDPSWPAPPSEWNWWTPAAR